MSSFSFKALLTMIVLAVLTITAMPNPAFAAQRSLSCGALSDSVCCERCMAGRMSNSHDSRNQAAANCTFGGMCNISHAQPAGPALRQAPPAHAGQPAAPVPSHVVQSPAPRQPAIAQKLCGFAHNDPFNLTETMSITIFPGAAFHGVIEIGKKLAIGQGSFTGTMNNGACTGMTSTGLTFTGTCLPGSFKAKYKVAVTQTGEFDAHTPCR